MDAPSPSAAPVTRWAKQFGAETILCDTTGMDGVLNFDPENGLVEVESGITWPSPHRGTAPIADRRAIHSLTIAQKQTGADQLSIGGAVGANIHGRGLRMRPFIADIESLTLVNPTGQLQRCSREENSDLFRLLVGGYGMFGIVYSVTLRLTRRKKMQRTVALHSIDEAMDAFDARIAAGSTYGDFQFITDETDPRYLCYGIMATYHEVSAAEPIDAAQRELTSDQWRNLILLAHTDKAKAYQHYTSHYLATHGQRYWSDTMQFSTYIENYHDEIDAKTAATAPGSEMITELYVPRTALAEFMKQTAEDFRRSAVNVIYGTVRLIERDDESFLAWARENWACIVFNLHVDHTPDGIARAAAAFRRLIDSAVQLAAATTLLTIVMHPPRSSMHAIPLSANCAAQTPPSTPPISSPATGPAIPCARTIKARNRAGLTGPPWPRILFLPFCIACAPRFDGQCA